MKYFYITTFVCALLGATIKDDEKGRAFLGLSIAVLALTMIIRLEI